MKWDPSMEPTPEHKINIHCERPSQRGIVHYRGGHRAHCSCGWSSDCYAQMTDTERAIAVHLRRARGSDFDGILARSSIGAAVADVEARGIDAHLADLEREMPARSKKRVPAAVKKPDRLPASDRAFMRGFGTALASIWNCHHDADMVRSILKENGFTPESFRGVGLEEVDLAAIRRAVQ